MQVDHRIVPDSEDGQYLVKCARIRDVTVSYLIKRVIATIARERLVEAVLDDNGSRKRHDRHVHHFKELT